MSRISVFRIAQTVLRVFLYVVCTGICAPGNLAAESTKLSKTSTYSIPNKFTHRYAYRAEGDIENMEMSKLAEEKDWDDEYTVLEYDPRFGYYLHLPENVEEIKNVPFVVIIHGLSRNARELFNIAVSSYPSWIILAPVFPKIIAPVAYCSEEAGFYDGDYYRMLLSQDSGNSLRRSGEAHDDVRTNVIRFDHILLAMICEAKLLAGLNCNEEHKVSLVGYSAGAQFSHRFAYLYASMLNVLAIGAPGSVTLWDESKPYLQGTKDLSSTFGKATELDDLKKVDVLFFVGSRDTKALKSEVGFGTSGGNIISAEVVGNRGDTPVTRIELIEDLYNNWEFLKLGKSRELAVIDGVGHDSSKSIGLALEFIDSVLFSNTASNQRMAFHYARQ